MSLLNKKEVKVYISGKVTGLDIKVVEKKFEGYEGFLSAIGLEPVNPLKKVTRDTTWDAQMQECIQILFTCDAIYMAGNWMSSRGARIEHKLAEELGLIILYESGKDNIMPFEVFNEDNRTKAWSAYMAVSRATNLSLWQFRSKSRTKNELYARMIMIHLLCDVGIECRVIAKFFSRSINTIHNSNVRFTDDFKYNKRFRNLAKMAIKYMHLK